MPDTSNIKPYPPKATDVFTSMLMALAMSWVASLLPLQTLSHHEVFWLAFGWFLARNAGICYERNGLLGAIANFFIGVALVAIVTELSGY